MPEVTPDTLAAIVEKHRDKVTVRYFGDGDIGTFYDGFDPNDPPDEHPGFYDYISEATASRTVEAELLRWLCEKHVGPPVEVRWLDVDIEAWEITTHMRRSQYWEAPTLVEALAAAVEGVEG